MLNPRLDKEDIFSINGKRAYRVIYEDGTKGCYASSLNCIVQLNIQNIKTDESSIIIRSTVSIPVKESVIIDSEVHGNGIVTKSHVENSKIYGKSDIEKSNLCKSVIMSSYINESFIFRTTIEKSCADHSELILSEILDSDMSYLDSYDNKIKNDDFI